MFKVVSRYSSLLTLSQLLWC